MDEFDKLDEINGNQDYELMAVGNTIDSMYTKLVNIEPDINLENLKIDVEVDESKVRKINQYLYESSEILIENLPAFDGSERIVENMSCLVKNTWHCATCGVQYQSDKTVFC